MHHLSVGCISNLVIYTFIHQGLAIKASPACSCPQLHPLCHSLIHNHFKTHVDYSNERPIRPDVCRVGTSCSEQQIPPSCPTWSINEMAAPPPPGQTHTDPPPRSDPQTRPFRSLRAAHLHALEKTHPQGMDALTCVWAGAPHTPACGYGAPAHTHYHAFTHMATQSQKHTPIQHTYTHS